MKEKVLVADNSTNEQLDIFCNSFDILRLIAAFIVLFSHSFRDFLPSKPVWTMWLSDGATGVEMLFGISGFLIFMSYDKCYKKKDRFLIFYLKRILRIYPALITMYLGVAVLDCINGENIFTLASAYTLVRAIIYPSASIYAVGIYNGVLCTLAYELTFYLLVPVLHRIYRNKGHLFWIISIIIMWLGNFLDSYLISYFGDTNILNFLYEFMLGAYLYMHRDTLLKKLARPKIAIGIIAIYTIIWNLYCHTDIFPHIGAIHPALIAWIMPFSVIVIAYSFGRINLKMDLSYGIYIWHMVIITELLMFLEATPVTMIIAWIITVIVAILSWTVVEHNCLNLSHYLVKKINSKNNS